MADRKENKSAFLVQGSILAIASVISRIIGLVYRVPLTNIIGDDGNNYYGAAFDIYNILLLISSYSLPLAVSKLVAARMAKGERLNVLRVLRGALVFAFVTGSIAFFVVFYFADNLTALLATPESYLALRVLGPTLLIVAVMGVIRGFFQGMGTMVPSAISQVLEQIVNAIVSVACAYVLFNYGLTTAALLGNSEKRAEAFGAAGGTLGTGAGALTALIFLVLILVIFLTAFKTNVKKIPARKQNVEAYSSIMVLLIFTIVPVLLSTTIYNISSILDQGFFKNIALSQGYSEDDVSLWWGVFVGKYKVLINVPIALASALAASAVPSITRAFTAKDMTLVKQKIESALRFIMFLAFPCAVGLFVLASPILILLFGDSREIGASMIKAGALSIIFYSISTLSNAVLQGIDKMALPVRNALAALVLHLVVLFVMMFGFDMNIYAVIWSNTLFALFMCIFNQISIHRHVKFTQEIKKTFIYPAVSSLVMGVAVYAIYTLSMNLCGINAISTVFAIITGIAVYFVLITRLGGITASELSSFPGGRTMVAILRKCRIM